MPKFNFTEEEIQVIYDALENLMDPNERPEEYNVISAIQYKLENVDTDS